MCNALCNQLQSLVGVNIEEQRCNKAPVRLQRRVAGAPTVITRGAGGLSGGSERAMEESVKLAPEEGGRVAEWHHGIAGTSEEEVGAKARTGKTCMPTNIPITADCDRS